MMKQNHKEEAAFTPQRQVPTKLRSTHVDKKHHKDSKKHACMKPHDDRPCVFDCVCTHSLHMTFVDIHAANAALF